MAGPESQGLPAAEIVSLARALGWPIVADPLSGLRSGTHDLDLVIDCADIIVRVPEFTAVGQPEVVLRFGAAMTSKPLNTWLASLTGVHRILVDAAEPSTGGWRDPDLQADESIGADPAAFAGALARVLHGAAMPDWAGVWTGANEAARRTLGDAVAALDEPFEGQPVYDLAAALPDGATLVAGNSMPVRDIDSFFANTDRRIRIVGTRGASGIDGVVSTAVGAAAADDGPVALLIGDLSFLHDLNGLWPVRRQGLNLTIVLVNNDGGGIFSFLPQRQATSRFDEWWGTPHGLDLSHGVALHGGRHQAIEAGSQAAAIAEALARPGLDVLELRTNRDRNVELHRQVWAQAIEAVAQVVGSRDTVRA